MASQDIAKGVTMGETIMVAEDDKTLQLLLKTSLTNQGFKVVVCSDGLAATSSLKKARPDLILLDLNLPKFNGIEFLKIVRQSVWSKSVPVIVMSGDITNDVVELGQKLGGVSYVSKPFEFDALAEKVATLLSIKIEKMSIDHPTIKNVLSNLKTPNPGMAKMVPSEIDASFWDIYSYILKSEEIVVLLPQGCKPHQMLEFTEEGLKKQMKVLHKKENKWEQLWPLAA